MSVTLADNARLRLLLVVGVRTVRQLSRVGHLGVRSLLGFAVNGPLLGRWVLNLSQIVVNRRLRTWANRLNDHPT